MSQERNNVIPVKLHLDKRASQILKIDADASDDDQLDTRSVAQWFGCSESWLEDGRSKGYGPPFVKHSPRMVRYVRGAVRKYLRDRTHKSTAEYR